MADEQIEMGDSAHKACASASRQEHALMGNGVTADVKITDAEEWHSDVQVLYKVDETPPWSLAVLFAFQHYISMFVANLAVPFLIAPAICMGEDNVGKSEMIGTLLVASGCVTLLQNIIGCRLPIVQAGTFALLVPTLAYLRLPQWTCPANIQTREYIEAQNVTNSSLFIEVGSEEHKELWMSRLREIQGAIMCAALFEVALGALGIVGRLMRFIGPLCITPTITLLGMSLFKSAAAYGSKQWPVCILTIVLVIVFSQYLGWVRLPCLVCTKEKGVYTQRFPLFRMFPIILAMLISWLVCVILTETNVFSPDPRQPSYSARTDMRLDAVTSSPWIRLPYPFQWGLPTVSLAGVVAILAGVMATTIESIGDYHACARLSAVPPPPLHAINRGILVEGLGSLLDGMLGTGNGTTSTTINVGVIGLTKVASRTVVMMCATLMIVFGVFTKFGALFVTVPDPIIGGVFFILFGTIVAVGISNLHAVDMGSSRNIFIVGFSILFGLSISEWIAKNPGAIDTGNQTVDSVCTVLLSIGMFMGGLIGLVLDCTIPGTYEERGMAQLMRMREEVASAEASPALLRHMSRIYDWPCGMAVLRRWTFTSYLPFMPTYGATSHRRNQATYVVNPADKACDS